MRYRPCRRPINSSDRPRFRCSLGMAAYQGMNRYPELLTLIQKGFIIPLGGLDIRVELLEIGL